jgi:hypothetical protein
VHILSRSPEALSKEPVPFDAIEISELQKNQQTTRAVLDLQCVSRNSAARARTNGAPRKIQFKANRRTPMRRNFTRLVLGMISLAMLATGFAPAHAATCTLASVAGNWGYTYTGVLILPTGPVPAAAVGRYTADVDGNISGTQTRTIAGATAQEVTKGSVTVNSDCTGTATVNIYDQSGNLLRTGTIAVTFVNNGRETLDLFTSLVLPDGTSIPVVITLNAKKQ